MTVTMMMRKNENDAEDDFDDTMFACFFEFLWFGIGPKRPHLLEFEHAELGGSTLRTYGWPNFPTSIIVIGDMW